jgi:hypothetical protein
MNPGAQAVLLVEGNTERSGMASCGGPGAVGDPERARMHLARDPGDPVTAHGRVVSAGRGGKSEDVIRR